VPAAQRPVAASKLPPLLKQSIALMQSIVFEPTCAVVFPRAQAALQAVNSASMLDPVQPVTPLITQFRAAAVSWLASCRTWFPLGLTQMASCAEC
jgi:hypothetical protein